MGGVAPISRPAYRHEGGPARGRHAPSTRHRPFDKLRTLQVGAVAAKAADGVGNVVQVGNAFRNGNACAAVACCICARAKGLPGAKNGRPSSRPKYPRKLHGIVKPLRKVYAKFQPCFEIIYVWEFGPGQNRIQRQGSQRGTDHKPKPCWGQREPGKGFGTNEAVGAHRRGPRRERHAPYWQRPDG